MHTPEPASAAARYVRELLTGLTSIGVEMHLICPGNFQFRTELLNNPLLDIHWTPERSISTRRGLLARIGSNLVFLFSSLIRFSATVRRRDIVHFQFALHFPFGAMFFLAAKLCGCKIVFTAHDPLPHKWLLPARLRWLEQGSLQWAYTVSDFLVAHSEPGKQVLTERFGQNPGKVVIIPHGPFGLGAGNIPMPASPNLEILLFGSIRENKGVHLAIEAAQRLHVRGKAVRLTIAGATLNAVELNYWNHCAELIGRNPEPIRVLRRFIPDEELVNLFGACHCVLLPYANGFHSDSGVALMALANARPLIATRSGGLGPLMDGADVAIPIDEGTVDGVANAILKALQFGLEDLTQRGRYGAEYVNRKFAWRTLAANTRDVYMKCVSTPSFGSLPDALGEGR